MTKEATTEKLNTAYNTCTVLGLKEELRMSLLTDTVLMVWGKPGIGKSEIIESVTAREGYTLLDRRVSYMLPEDFFGIPVADRDARSTLRLKPDLIADVERAQADSGRPVCILLDELTSAGSPGVFAACYQLILNRCLGGFCLPEGTRIIAAGNRAEDKGVVYDIPMPLANRMSHVEFEGPTWDEYELWAQENDVHPHVLTFLKQAPQYLHGKIVTRGNKDGRNPTPRSWSFLSRKLHTADQLGLSHAFRLRTAAATVGDEAALKLETIMRLAEKLVSYETILRDPLKAPVYPDDISASYLLMMLLVQRISTQKEFDTVFPYVERMPQELIGVFFRAVLRAPKKAAWLISRRELIVKYQQFASASLKAA